MPFQYVTVFKMREMVGGCCVCSDERGWNENPLVYCDGQGCSVAVHQACYGIVSVPQGSWFCEKCRGQERSSKVRCELCPKKEGALKHTDNGGWAHVVCALYIPEVRFGNVTTMDPIVLSHVPQDRYNRRCYLCEKYGDTSNVTYGACMQCSFRQGCKTYFHVTCAQQEGLLCEESGHFDNIKYCGYCDSHIKKLKRELNTIKVLPPFKNSIGKNKDLGRERQPSSNGNSEVLSSNTKASFPVSKLSPSSPTTSPVINNLDDPLNITATNSTLQTSGIAHGVRNGPNNLSSEERNALVQSELIVEQQPALSGSFSTLKSQEISPLQLSSLTLPANVSNFAQTISSTSVSGSTSFSNINSVQPQQLSHSQGLVVSVYDDFGETSSTKNTSTNNRKTSSLIDIKAAARSTVRRVARRRRAVGNGTVDSKGDISDEKRPRRALGPGTVSTAVGPGKRTVKSLLEDVSHLVTDTVSSFHTERSGSQRDVMLSPSLNMPPIELTSSMAGSAGLSSSGNVRIPQLSGERLSNLSMGQPNASSSSISIDLIGTSPSVAVPIPLPGLPSGGSRNLHFTDVITLSSIGTPVLSSAIVENSQFLSPTSVPSGQQWVGPPNPFQSVRQQQNAAQQLPTSSLFNMSLMNPGNLIVSPSTSNVGQSNQESVSQINVPSSLEQLLERHWEQGSQFLMEQAQHFDIASLLSCLHQLKNENQRLDVQISALGSRRDHLLTINARLGLPLSVQGISPAGSSNQHSPRVGVAPASGGSNSAAAVAAFLSSTESHNLITDLNTSGGSSKSTTSATALRSPADQSPNIASVSGVSSNKSFQANANALSPGGMRNTIPSLGSSGVFTSVKRSTPGIDSGGTTSFLLPTTTAGVIAATVNSHNIIAATDYLRTGAAAAALQAQLNLSDHQLQLYQFLQQQQQNQQFAASAYGLLPSAGTFLPTTPLATLIPNTNSLPPVAAAAAAGNSPVSIPASSVCPRGGVTSSNTVSALNTTFNTNLPPKIS